MKSRSLFDDSRERRSLEAERVFDAQMAVRRKQALKLCIPLGLALVAAVWGIVWYQQKQARAAEKERRAKAAAREAAATESVARNDVLPTEAGFEMAGLKLELVQAPAEGEGFSRPLAELLLEASDCKPSTIRFECKDARELAENDLVRTLSGGAGPVVRATCAVEGKCWEKMVDFGARPFSARELMALVNEWYADAYPGRGAVFGEGRLAAGD